MRDRKDGSAAKRGKPRAAIIRSRRAPIFRAALALGRRRCETPSLLQRPETASRDRNRRCVRSALSWSLVSSLRSPLAFSSPTGYLVVNKSIKETPTKYKEMFLRRRYWL